MRPPQQLAELPHPLQRQDQLLPFQRQQHFTKASMADLRPARTVLPSWAGRNHRVRHLVHRLARPPASPRVRSCAGGAPLSTASCPKECFSAEMLSIKIRMSRQSTRCDSLRCRHPQIVAAGPYPSCASISITTCNFTSSMRAALCCAIPSAVSNAAATDSDKYSPCGGMETGRDREHRRPHRTCESRTALRPSVLSLLIYLLRQSSLQC